MATGTSASTRKLFGGALEIALPIAAVDVSGFRQVPDHQEVFCRDGSDQCIIIEILEHQETVDGNEAARFHFQDLAESNDASRSEVIHVEEMPVNSISIPICSTAHFLIGSQSVSKFNEDVSASNKITLYVVLFRLPQFGSDLLVTMNTPVEISCFSSSFADVANGNSTANGNAVYHPTDGWSLETFKEAIVSLVIKDTKLFNA